MSIVFTEMELDELIGISINKGVELFKITNALFIAEIPFVILLPVKKRRASNRILCGSLPRTCRRIWAATVMIW